MSAGVPLAALLPVYAHSGPFVTVYLDVARAPGEGVDDVVERWATVRADLAAAGADDDDLDAVEDDLTVDLDAFDLGLVLVAAAGELVLRATLPVPPADSGHLSRLPRLLPYALALAPAVPNLVVDTSPGRTRLLTLEPGGLRLLRTVAGAASSAESASVLRPSFNREAARQNPEVVLFCGDLTSRQRAVTAVTDVLPPDVEVRASEPAFDDVRALSAAAIRTVRDCLRPELQELAARSDRSGDHIVRGRREVSLAVRMAQAETVVVRRSDDLSSPCWVGARPTEFELREVDLSRSGAAPLHRDVLGSALLRAVVGTGAGLVVLDPSPRVRRGPVAILRYAR